MAQDLNSIVQRMIDAGETEENIASVIQEYNKPKPATATNDGPFSLSYPRPIHEPTNFAAGALNSLTSGEASRAGEMGARGFVKGATLDLPQGIYGALKTVADLATNPAETLSGIPGALRGMWDLTTKAGGQPEEFGRMMGNVAGQPLVTEGIVKGLPSKAAIGGGMAATGGFIERNTPFSGMIPGGRYLVPPTARLAERLVGRGMKNLGNKLRIPTLEGEIVGPDISTVKNGQIVQELLDEAKSTQHPASVDLRKALNSYADLDKPSPSPSHGTSTKPTRLKKVIIDPSELPPEARNLKPSPAEGAKRLTAGREDPNPSSIKGRPSPERKLLTEGEDISPRLKKALEDLGFKQTGRTETGKFEFTSRRGFSGEKLEGANRRGKSTAERITETSKRFDDIAKTLTPEAIGELRAELRRRYPLFSD